MGWFIVLVKQVRFIKEMDNKLNSFDNIQKALNLSGGGQESYNTIMINGLIIIIKM